MDSQTSDFTVFAELFAPAGTRLFRQEAGQEDRESLAELTLDVWQDHLGSGPHVGAYLQRADGKVRFSMFDIDVWPRDVPRAEMLRQMEDLRPSALRAREALEHFGLSREQVLVEFSGTGYHLWVFYEEPIPAALAQRFMQRAQARAGSELVYKPRYPFERDRDRVWLPLRVNHNQGMRSTFVEDLETFDPSQYPQEVNLRSLVTVQQVDIKRVM